MKKFFSIFFIILVGVCALAFLAKAVSPILSTVAGAVVVSLITIAGTLATIRVACEVEQGD